MTPNEMRSELIHVAAEMVRGLHGEDIVFSKTTPWYVRARVDKVIDAADEKSKVLAMRLKKVADALSAIMRAEKETIPARMHELNEKHQDRPRHDGYGELQPRTNENDPETGALCPTTGQPHRMPEGQPCLYCAEVCKTCHGRREIGVFALDSGVETVPCPDCTATNR